jgi:hypothetical protein
LEVRKSRRDIHRQIIDFWRPEKTDIEHAHFDFDILMVEAVRLWREERKRSVGALYILSAKSAHSFARLHMRIPGDLSTAYK